MQALLDAIGSFGKLGAEALHASEQRRAEILAEADAAYRAYRESLAGLFAGLAADDEEMANLARPLPTPAAPPAPVPAPPATTVVVTVTAPATPMVEPEPTGDA